MIKIFVYNRRTGCLIREDIGLPEQVINDLASNEDFTLTAPLFNSRSWKWNGSEWVKADEQSKAR